MIEHILCDDLLAEREHLGVDRVHADSQPVHVRRAEILYPGEVLDRTAAFRPDERFVDPEIMSVAVNQHDWPAVCEGFLFHGSQEIAELRATDGLGLPLSSWRGPWVSH